jgi:hypothetical protein
MADRRQKPANRWGCKPIEDVCVEHDEPLTCRHGCEHARPHQCAERTETKRDIDESMRRSMGS